MARTGGVRGGLEKAPRVSVIIPVFGNEETIERCVGSILAQDFGDLEIVAVDDGSPDDSAARLCAIDDPRIRLIRQENRGEGSARNRGMLEARAPIVTFLDGDDEWLPHRLGHAMSVLEANPGVRVCVSGYLQIDHPGQEPFSTRERWRGRRLETGVFRCRAESDPGQVMTQVDYMVPWTTTVEREVALGVGGYWDRCRRGYGIDTWFLFRLLVSEAVHFDERPVAVYHHEASNVTDFRKCHPLEPYLASPEEFEKGCPAELRPLVRAVCARMAVQTARHFCLWGKGRTARSLLRRFEVARRHPGQHLLCLMLSGLSPLTHILRPLYYELKRWRGQYVPSAFRKERSRCVGKER